VRIADAGSLALELIVSAPPGSGIWGVNVGLDSHAPAFTEHQIGCFNIIRDGRPHAYQLDIPLMLAGDIHHQVFGPGVTAPDSGLKVAARLVWRNPDFAPVSLSPITVEGAGSGFVALVCRSVHVSAAAK
jgi:hypothetical protein